MRAVTGAAAALLAAFILSACAHDRPEASGAAPGDGAEATGTDLEESFVDLHATLIRELAARQSAAAADPRVIEARAIVDAAEEAYLGDNVGLALRLVENASRILEPDS